MNETGSRGGTARTGREWTGSLAPHRVLSAAIRRLLGRPLFLVPFLPVGLVAAAWVLALQRSALPIAGRPFPAQGLVHLPIVFLPGLQNETTVRPGTLIGLKPQYVVLLVGWSFALLAVATVAFAITVWLASPERDGVLPPARRVGWLGIYALLTQGLFLVAAASPTVRRLGVVLPLVALGVVALMVGLFLAPAFVVLDGWNPLDAARASVSLVGGRPLSVGVLVVVLTYLGYFLTGVGYLAPAGPWGLALGAAVSAVVAGPLYALAMVDVYRRRPERAREFEMADA